MGLFDFVGDIFGGGSSIQGQGIEQVSTLTGGQRKLLNELTGQVRPLIPQALTPFEFQAAGPSALQQQAFGGFGGLAGLAGQNFGIAGQQLGQFDPSQSQGFLQQAGGALGQGLQGFDPSRITDALEPGRQLALRTFQRDIAPDLLERFGATSGQSGGLNRALSEAGAGLSLGLGAQAAPFLGQAALQAPGQQFQGAQLAGNLAQLPGQLAGQGSLLAGQGADILTSLLGAGGAQRGISAEQLAAQQQTGLDPRGLLSGFGGLALGTPAFENIGFQGFRQPSVFETFAAPLGAGISAFAQAKFGDKN